MNSIIKNLYFFQNSFELKWWFKSLPTTLHSGSSGREQTDGERANERNEVVRGAAVPDVT
jgi:hypothetical protein